MPTGRYDVIGEDGRPEGEESFRCAPGPAGWRYFSEVTGAGAGMVDLVADAAWNVVRVRFRSPAGELLLETHGDRIVGVRGDETLEFLWRPELHVDVFSPVTNLLTTKRLTGTEEIEVLYVERDSLDISFTSQRYERLGEETVETAVGSFAATRWRFVALDSAWTGDLWVAGDVVVRYERTFELAAYEPGATGPVPSP
jgi:Putative glycolipid-binding